jgi:hypothetical protein
MSYAMLDESIEAYLDGSDDPALLAELERALAEDPALCESVRRDIGWDLALRATLHAAPSKDRVAGIIAALPVAGSMPGVAAPLPRQPQLVWRPLVVLAAAATLIASVGVLAVTQVEPPRPAAAPVMSAALPKAPRITINAAPTIAVMADTTAAVIALP